MPLAKMHKAGGASSGTNWRWTVGVQKSLTLNRPYGFVLVKPSRLLKNRPDSGVAALAMRAGCWAFRDAGSQALFSSV